jgi:hypothetical protein
MGIPSSAGLYQTQCALSSHLFAENPGVTRYQDALVRMSAKSVLRPKWIASRVGRPRPESSMPLGNGRRLTQASTSPTAL